MNIKERLKWLMSMIGSNGSSGKLVAADNIISNNIFNLSSHKNVYVDRANKWATKSESRSLRRWLHTHVFLNDFIDAYSLSGDQKYFEESFKILMDWNENFSIDNRKDIGPLAYHDEGTSQRLLFWFKYYYYFYEELDSSQKLWLENRIDETADLLPQDSFYAGLNNHGFFQDMSLVAYTIFRHENFSESGKFKKAMYRIESYFKNVFTTEGVHKEHAPSYHLLLIYSLKKLLVVLKTAEYNDEVMSHLVNIYNKSEHYIINVTMPDYKLPNISDSTRIDMINAKKYQNLYESEQYQFITSGGTQGKEPSTLINIYPETGYLIARDYWRREGLFFLFLASYHMRYHKHTDDLSFILYKNGPIFIDAGPHSYNYNNPFTKYAYSQYAHSTLVLGGESLPRTDNKYDKVFINNYKVNELNKTFNIEGINSRYSFATHSRRVKGDLNKEEFSIIDTVCSQKLTNFKLLFQVDGDLKVVREGSIFSILRNNFKVAELELISSSGLKNIKLFVVHGQESPEILGFQFPKTESIKKSNTIILEGENFQEETVINTKIKLKNFQNN